MNAALLIETATGALALVLFYVVRSWVLLRRVSARYEILAERIVSFENRIGLLDLASADYYLSLGSYGANALYRLRSDLKRMQQFAITVRGMICLFDKRSILAAYDLLSQSMPDLPRKLRGVGAEYSRFPLLVWQENLEQEVQDFGAMVAQAIAASSIECTTRDRERRAMLNLFAAGIVGVRDSGVGHSAFGSRSRASGGRILLSAV